MKHLINEIETLGLQAITIEEGVKMSYHKIGYNFHIFCKSEKANFSIHYLYHPKTENNAILEKEKSCTRYAENYRVYTYVTLNEVAKGKCKERQSMVGGDDKQEVIKKAIKYIKKYI